MGKAFTLLCIVLVSLTQTPEAGNTVQPGPGQEASAPAAAPAAAPETAPAPAAAPAASPAPASVPGSPLIPGTPGAAAPRPGVTGAPAAARRPWEQQEIITDYWRHINEILASEAARRERYDRAPTGKYPPPRSFAFDNFQHLKSSDLLRAVNEGIREARKAGQNKPPAEVDHQVKVNVNLTFEYYPMLVSSDADFKSLLYPIQDMGADPMYRVFLIERAAPGVVERSLFSDYFQDNVRQERPELKRLLIKVCGDPIERADVQLAALDAYHALLLDEYSEAMNKDLSIRDYAAKSGKAIAPKLLLEPGDFVPGPDTMATFDRLATGFEDFVAVLGKLMEPNNSRPAEVKLAARRHIERIYGEMHLKDRDSAKRLLEQFPEESLKANQQPGSGQ